MRRLVLFTLVSLASAPAIAHPEWSPVQVNRYFKLVLGEKNRVVYTVLYGDAPALPERTAADANHDGKLDAHERELLGARIASRVSAGLHMELDGAPWSPAPLVDVGLAGEEVAPEPFSVDLTYPLAMDGVHELVVDDRVEVTHEGDSEIAAEVGAPATLLAAQRGPTARTLEGKVFTFRGPRFSLLEDRRVALRFETRPPRLASRLRGRWQTRYSAMIVAAVLAALLVAVRRYRSMNG